MYMDLEIGGEDADFLVVGVGENRDDLALPPNLALTDLIWL